MRFGSCFALLALLLLLPAVGLAVEFSNKELSTSIELPDGYQNVTKAMGGKALIALRRGRTADSVNSGDERYRIN